tara:strand:- start:820 stop:1230 length:411 start_codon:yes stop_codon:yes gene_type:complete
MNSKEIIDQVSKMTEDAKEALIDPISAYIRLYELEKIVAEHRKEISDLALDKRQMIAEKEWTQNGYKVSTVSQTRYTYPNDDTLERHKLAIKNRQDLMKQASFSAKNGRDFFDEYGEIVTPANTKTTTYLKLEWNE